MRFPSSHHLRDEVGTEHDVGIKAEQPISACRPDSLVLSGGKSNVPLVVDHPPAWLNLTQELSRAVRRGIVHNYYLEVAIVLLLDRSEARIEILCRIPGNDCDGDHW